MRFKKTNSSLQQNSLGLKVGPISILTRVPGYAAGLRTKVFSITCNRRKSLAYILNPMVIFVIDGGKTLKISYPCCSNINSSHQVSAKEDTPCPPTTTVKPILDPGLQL